MSFLQVSSKLQCLLLLFVTMTTGKMVLSFISRCDWWKLGDKRKGIQLSHVGRGDCCQTDGTEALRTTHPANRFQIPCRVDGTRNDEAPAI